MATLSTPTIVLLPGSFQLPEIYYDFAKLIESHGFPVVQPEYPSLDQADPNLSSRDLDDDATVAEAAIRDIVEEHNKTAIIVMHSYGGLVGAESVPQELTVNSRQEKGLDGGVKHLFYFSAFVMALGRSVYDTIGNSTQHDFFDGLFVLKDPLNKMYNDLPLPEAKCLARKVIPQSAAVLKTPMKRAAYRYLPSTFVKLTADQAILPPVQDAFANLAGSTVKTINSGHSAFLSHPKEVVALLEEVAKL
ncbi:catalytic protein [Corynespora cassiicola Philippines]|uniref:Catalytic protein n=1 Tax=Corynespora cassiicola Philippines TaxID=1448308 RepID=A0A2T2NQK9_CORCC|nr:catalytic protein [Corynespora cassiicola Philippines]